MNLNSDEKARLIQECKDELNLCMAGAICSPRHVKLLCKYRIQYLNWKISRIEKNKPFDTPPSTIYYKPPIEVKKV